MFDNRWRVDGTITTRGPMRIGTGAVRQRTDVAATGILEAARDAFGRPYIPGSTLKGAIRAVLQEAFGTEDGELHELLGQEPGRGPEGEGEGGKAEFLDAFLQDGAVPGDGLSLYNTDAAEPWIGVEASASIDRHTGTAADSMLAHQEIVPPGVPFDVTVTGSDLTDRQVAFLRLGFELLEERDVRLGGNAAFDHGPIAWEHIADRCFGSGAQLAEWLQHGNGAEVLDDGLPIFTGTAVNDAVDELRHTARSPAEIVIDLELEIDGRFIANDAIQVARKTQAKERDRKRQGGDGDEREASVAGMPRRNSDGDVLLPGTTLLRTLRAQAEKIERTLFGDTAPTYKGSSRRHGHDDALTAAEWLFGTTRWAKAVSIAEPFVAADARVEGQYFNAIDRFTGGTADKKLYRIEAAVDPVFRGSLRIDLGRARPHSVGPFILALCDLLEGDVTLGGHAAKGYGWVRQGGITGLRVVGDGPAARRCRPLEQLSGFDPADPATHPGEDCDARTLVNALVAAWRGRQPRAASQTATAGRSEQHRGSTPGTVKGAGRRSARDPSEGARFLNPYNFVPALKNPDGYKEARWIRNSNFQDSSVSLGRLTHDRWLSHSDKKALMSGRILCRLETRGPMFVGAGEHSDTSGAPPKRLAPFELVPGAPAIPASSLRGMLSTIVEAASNSALRVLEDQPLERYGKNRATTHDFFKSIDPDLVPYHPENRNWISPAEALFGFVYERDEEDRRARSDEDTSRPARSAYRGRVRMSFARLAREQASDGSEPYLDWRVLRILSSPKPPCPPLYLRLAPENGRTLGPAANIHKNQIKLGRQWPNGRKFYHGHGDVSDGVGATKLPDHDPKQKVRVKPIKPGRVFWFHLDVDNADPFELALLLFALRPTDGFVHRIGMGKPLGLGRAEITPIGMLEVDRTERYTAADLFTRPRWSRVEAWHRWPEGDAPDRYRSELDALGEVEVSVDSLAARIDTLSKTLHEKAGDAFAKLLEAIIRVGEEPPESTEIAYPQLPPRVLAQQLSEKAKKTLKDANKKPSDLAAQELEAFRWHKANEDSTGTPISALPPLLREDDEGRLEVPDIADLLLPKDPRR